MDLPIQYMQYMQKLLGEAYPDFAASFSCKSYHALRVNELKINKSEITDYVDLPLEKVPYVSNGFYYEDDIQKLSKSPFYSAGLYYLQEPSAMLPADRLPIEPGDIVLDLCAAPGGKSTAILSKLNGSGMLISNDYSYSRAQALLKNLEYFGGNNYMVCAEDSSKLAKLYSECFDKILVDAPCSGEGMFRKDPSLIKDWNDKGPKYYAPMQRNILDDAVHMLKKGGLLMYSTCTFSVAEDEENVRYILDNYPDMKPVNIEKSQGLVSGFLDLDEAVRVFPHNVKGEGHFLCLLKKENKDLGTEYKNRTERIAECPKNIDELNSFLKLITSDIFTENLFFLNNQVYSLPSGYEKIYNKSIRFLRTGLLIGEIDKNKRFKPSSALALSLRKSDFLNTFDMNREDIRIHKYLSGETIILSDEDEKPHDGYVLVCIEGFGLGFAKYLSGKLKNLLGKGFILG